MYLLFYINLSVNLLDMLPNHKFKFEMLVAVSWRYSKWCMLWNVKAEPADFRHWWTNRGFVIQRDNEWHAVYAGATANIYVNPVTIHGGELNEWEK